MVGAQQIERELNLNKFLTRFLNFKRRILKADDRCLGQLGARKIVNVNGGYDTEDK